MNRAFATVAFVWALALGSHVSADITRDCQSLENRMREMVAICFNEALREMTSERECEKMLQLGVQMVRWCNSNISSCPADKNGYRWVEWHYNYGNWGTTFNPLYGIMCLRVCQK
jgi:hypothetical protein